MESLSEVFGSPVGLIAAGALAFLIGSLVFNVKQWEAHWKQWAIDTSKAMSKAGLVHTPRILDALAVGDLAGAFQQIKGLADIFKDPQQLAAEFQTVFQNMLDAACKDPTQARSLQQLANDAVAAFASGDPAQGAGQLAADAQGVARANPLFSSLAQNGLALPPFAPLGGGSLLTNIAGALGNAGLGHLFPLAAAGLQTVQSAVGAGAPAAPVSAAPASLPTVPAGHTVTIAGPATPAVEVKGAA